MMDFRIFKKSMVVAAKILFILYFVVWLFPFIPPVWAWGYAFFVVALFHLAGEQ